LGIKADISGCTINDRPSESNSPTSAVGRETVGYPVYIDTLPPEGLEITLSLSVELVLVTEKEDSHTYGAFRIPSLWRIGRVTSISQRRNISFFRRRRSMVKFNLTTEPSKQCVASAMFFADDDFSTNFYFLERTMRKPGTVLDVGCGGGNMFYLSVGPTVGIDLAFASLKRASAVYPQVARAKVEALPLPNNAFDYVVSTDVLEHLSPTVKDKALSEMTRVLKPGGLMIHIVQ